MIQILIGLQYSVRLLLLLLLVAIVYYYQSWTKKKYLFIFSLHFVCMYVFAMEWMLGVIKEKYCLDRAVSHLLSFYGICMHVVLYYKTYRQGRPWRAIAFCVYSKRYCGMFMCSHKQTTKKKIKKKYKSSKENCIDIKGTQIQI